MDKQQVVETMQRMADIVDRRRRDAAYRPMAPNSTPWPSRHMDLVFDGEESNGYTEATLMRRRRTGLSPRAADQP